MIFVKRRLIRALSALAAAGVLTGCAVQSENWSALSEPLTPANWSHPALSGSETFETEAFWAAWNDPVLDALVRRAVENNTDVLSALANLRAARARVTSATSALFPTFSGGGNGRTTRTSGNQTESWQATLSGDWTINLAGREYRLNSSAEWSALASWLTVKDVEAAVAAETAQAYVNLRSAQINRRIVEDSIRSYRENEQLARWQVTAGLATASDAEDAISQLRSAEARLPEIDRGIQEYKNALARLTVQSPEALPESLSDTGAALPTVPEGLAVRLPADTLRQRPDVRGAEMQLRSAAEAVDAAEAAFFPSLSLSGSLGTQAATIGMLGASGTGIATLLGGLSVPLLNWGGLVAQEESARATLDSAKANYLAVVTGALEETDNALTGIRSSEERVRRLSEAVEHAEVSNQLARLEYESGIGDYLTLLTSERTLLTARETALANDTNRVNYYIMLYRALGGGWTPENGPDTESVKE